MTPEEFRRLGHELVDWIADYRERIDELPVMSPLGPGEVKARLPATPPEEGGSLDAIARDVEELIRPGITHWNHPRFFAYFPSNTSLAAVLADLVASGFGAQAMSWQTSPAAAELEEVVMDWLRQMLGLPATFTGVIHDTASVATLCALLEARERATRYSQEEGGLQESPVPLTIYASAEAHSSVEKAARLAGFGQDHVRAIPTDDAHALRLDLLAEAIQRDRDAGRRPAALVASIGTTATTAIDPLAGMAEIAGRQDLWLHVDAALAGCAMILPECRPLWRGIERADSLVVNPHKWLGVGFDLSAYFVRDVPHLLRVMSTSPSYLRTAEDPAVRNYRDWGIQLGRRFRALKLWFLLRDQGVRGLQARLRRDLANARWLQEEVDATPGWERLAPVPLQTVCLRHVPARLAQDEKAIDQHNLALAERINRGGRAYLTSALLKGRRMIRVSIGSELTERAHVEALWQLLRDTAAALP
ncbi:MAG TPA: pyridoxal-dependent decarboxylase [Polyangia bacterium]|nr:pyridoxal-dependent decarboxylase [Polyangia bacterium]